MQPARQLDEQPQRRVYRQPLAVVTGAGRGRPVDLLINNAAQGAPHQPLGGVDAAGVLNAVDVNAAGPLRMVQALLPQLLESDERRSPSFVSLGAPDLDW